MDQDVTENPNDSDQELIIRRPDDWHVHLRDGPMLAAVVNHTARQFARAIVMPNLVPPVTTVAMASAYRERIQAAAASVWTTRQNEQGGESRPARGTSSARRAMVNVAHTPTDCRTPASS